MYILRSITVIVIDYLLRTKHLQKIPFTKKENICGKKS